MKRITLILGLCLLLVVVCFAINSSKVSPVFKTAPISQTPSIPTPVFAKAIRVYDGDTIEIEGGQKVRYIGIDTAEVYPSPGCFSKEALAKNKELVLGKIVKLEKDVSETDKYGRLLRYVYVDDRMVNEEMVKGGFAKIETVPPDVKYQQVFLNSEEYAKKNFLGLWGKCE